MTTEIIPSASFMPALSFDQVIERRNAIVDFTKSAMKHGVDYGAIPGTDKPTLLKPGAEKLCSLFGLTPTFQVVESIKDWTGKEHGEPLFYFEYRCKLYRGAQLVAEGDGNCHSWEKKYRYRDAKRICPHCHQPTIFKSKREPGYYCWAKPEKGINGCGAKFRDNDPAITSQEVGQVVNPDVFDLVNTISKMAQKRALIAATLLAVNASEFFTQDMDEQYIDAQYTVEPAVEHGRADLLAEVHKLYAEATETILGFQPQNDTQLQRLTDKQLREEIAWVKSELVRVAA